MASTNFIDAEANSDIVQLLHVDQQARGSIISDPHAAEMGIHFPFLIVESKGWSSKGTLVSAQNQAAVGGACMLKILEDLTYQAARGTDLHPKQAPPSAETSSELALCFSMVAEGPIHELWVHFEHEGVFHMENIKVWRTTNLCHAQKLVNSLGRVVGWGQGGLKDSIVKKLCRFIRY